MTSDRKKPGIAFWATVALLAVLAYGFSVGPACWVSSRANSGASTVSLVYRPLMWGMSQNARIAEAADWYSQLGAPDGWVWVNAEHWRHMEPDRLGQWLGSPKARAIRRNLGVE